MVIMAPEMLDILDPPANVQKTEIFLIREDWAYDGDFGTSTQVVADPQMARFIFNNLIYQEHLDGCIADWKGRADLEVDARTDCYECWLHDEYFENHYKIAIDRAELSVPEQLFQQFGKGYIARSLKEDLASQVEQWEEVSRLTEDQFLKFISDPNIPERIESHLSKNDSYWDSYWESISECAHSMLHDYLMQISKEDCFRPEPNNLYPLCEGNGTESCLKCCVYKDYSEGNGQD
ncbi:MAG: hypothetical protein IJ307_00990 [Bacteroidales bacterium]|nr:hypothetical protein [Bacteroidales bacterium]